MVKNNLRTAVYIYVYTTARKVIIELDNDFEISSLRQYLNYFNAPIRMLLQLQNYSLMVNLLTQKRHNGSICTIQLPTIWSLKYHLALKRKCKQLLIRAKRP